MDKERQKSVTPPKNRHRKNILKTITGPLKEYIKEDPNLIQIKEFLAYKKINPNFTPQMFMDYESLIEDAKDNSLQFIDERNKLQDELNKAYREIDRLNNELHVWQMEGNKHTKTGQWTKKLIPKVNAGPFNTTFWL